MSGAQLPLLVIGGVILVVLFWALSVYNALVGLRQHVKESWSNIDTELQRRHDLIPNLVSTVKAYAEHEREVFESVTRARAEAVSQRNQTDSGHGVEALARRENALATGLGRLLAVAEAYPDLKASSQFTQLQRELVTTEDRIQAARRFYNANVRDLNTRVRTVPSNLIASMFGFEAAEYFEVQSVEVRQTPRVDLGAGG